ncbi:MAG TPA: nucleoside triphosphate pyrophosphohydrolase family protein [Saprospiraceae bacterium]|nr:nucleoside triphosphate pyrophosphohydrolase family protein [Saprospiraceae bacterium]HRO07801.1 nucleoside triphosphate pyrophosphohydrolase family protein [Saprospiraceae bacterium]HRO73139.1 nucleoside triphosphate pyrophosphohydrolase family protein [Saprospiraceae bacterium]HRP40973.1 nucleoside triphosphate pyrophosphohydrolase family protein [Saprospiraceae bacterium]
MAKKYKIFDEPSALTSVAAFHDLFELPVVAHPTIPDEIRCQLRVSLLQEELNELKQAIEDNDIVEIADALADLQYVLSGAVLEFGLGDRFKRLFDEVQRSNMSKTCASVEEALATQQHYKDIKNVDSYITEREGEYIVYRNEDGKVLKSIAYSAANLRDIVHQR